MAGDIAIGLLQRLFTLMSSSTGAHAIFSGIADTASTMLEADGVAIFEYDDVRDRFALGTARDLSLEAQVQTMQVLARRARLNATWLSYLQLLTDWGAQLQQEMDSPAEDLRDLQGMISVPLRTGKGDLLGLLVVFYRDPEAMSGRRQVLASLLGSLAAVSLENWRLYEVERHRADFLAEVLRVGEALQVDQSLEAMLQQVAQIIAETLGWGTVVIVLFDFEAGVRRPAAWVSAEKDFRGHILRAMQTTPLPLTEPLYWRDPAFKISRSYFGDHRLAGAPSGSGAVTTLEATAGFKRTTQLDPTRPVSNQWHPDDFLVVPMTCTGIDLGWIAVDSPRDNRRPDLGRIQELEVFADQLAQAITNVRLYNEAEHERLKLTTVLDGITDGVLAFDAQERLMFSNPAAERLLGMALPRLPGDPLASALAGSPLLGFLLGQDGAEPPTSGELYLPEARRTLLITVTPLADAGRVIVMRDVTYFREMDTLRLELLSSLSHDLKNPLAAIDLQASLIERAGELNERQKRYVDLLRQSSRRAVTMISDLLDMARLEAGEQIPEETCWVSVMLDDVIEAMQVHADDKHILLMNEMGALPPVRGDETRLRQVFANLISNAIKYTPEGGRVTISASASETELTVYVADTGIGIPDEHLPRIFDRFYRVNPTMSDSVEGTGLGLSIVKTVVERHGGRVTVESTEGEGSTFSVVLPLASD